MNGIPDLILQYFFYLFRSKGCTDENIIEVVPCRATQEKNEFLERPYSAEEIRIVIMGMHPHKSPGPDRMSPGFFQKHWDIIDGSASDACLSYLNSRYLPNGLNDTTICLVPKKKSPERRGDLRSIFYAMYSTRLSRRLLPIE